MPRFLNKNEYVNEITFVQTTVYVTGKQCKCQLFPWWNSELTD